MYSRLRFVFLSALVFIGCVVPSSASLLGTSVTGSLDFLGHPLNYFNPSNGFVPATGYENSSGTTVTIAEPAIEFGAVFPANTDGANFTSTQLIVTDVVDSAGINTPFTLTFSNTTFSGLVSSKVSDTFANGGTTASLTGDTLTVSWNGGSVGTGTLRTVYNLVSSIPEPGSGALLLVGTAAVLWSRFSRSAGHSWSACARKS
jgi:hypothetical protein